MSVGSSISETSTIRLAVLGAPGDADDDANGFVQVTDADPSLHELSATSPRNIQLTAPAGGTDYQFGYALGSGNFNRCRIVSGYDYACGEELLVGAPDTFTHSQGGEVYVYEPNNDLSIDTILTYIETIPDPVGSLSGEFGSAIAVAASRAPNRLEPWETGDIAPDWVAIGAPGDERVELYTVNTAAVATGSPAFTWVGTVHNPIPTLASGFGAVLATANLDHDANGWPELVVSAPDDIGGGSVLVYKGVDPSTGALFEPIPLVLTRGGAGMYPLSTQDDGFGLALGAGHVLMDDAMTLGITEADALLVGAPLTLGDPGGGTTYPDAGAVCQFTFQESGAPSKLVVDVADCRHAVVLAAGDRYGAAIAIGDFGAVDGNGQIYTDAAYLRDIAISSPGALGGKGLVEVYASQEDGFDVAEGITFLNDSLGAAGDEYGATLASGYVGETTWADLLIGAPGDDRGHLTLAVDSGSGTCADLDGAWLIDGQKFQQNTGNFTQVETELLVWDEGGVPVLYFQDDYSFNIVDGTGNVCEVVLDGSSKEGTGFCDALELSAVAGGAPTVTPSVETIGSGTRLELNTDCATAFDGVDTFTWTGVPVGAVIQANIDPRLWGLMTTADQAALQNVKAEVILELSSAPAVAGTTGTAEIVVDWGVAVWPKVNVLGCNFGFAADCVQPAVNTFTGGDELPAPVRHDRENVCEG
ncbi:MAG: hypothetical protein GY913_16520 [Proteobacteria bacterium]|nr:hypothetical protein [Pseudomonadota bacterium]